MLQSCGNWLSELFVSRFVKVNVSLALWMNMMIRESHTETVKVDNRDMLAGHNLSSN